MKLEQWKTYRTRFLVKAKQLSSSLSFVDHLGRQHCGRKGDYLVESSDGVLSITPRRIFEDIYVPMSLQQPGDPVINAPLINAPVINDAVINDPAISQNTTSAPMLDRLKLEPLELEEVKLPKPVSPERVAPGQVVARDQADRVRRKLPQPCRVRPSSDLRLM